MSTPMYAKDQPAGFTNRIERVAIVGAGGKIGKPITDALVAEGKHTITVLTREDSETQLPRGVKVARVNYEKEESVISALRGQQFLLIAMATTAPPGSQEKIIAAAAKAGVPWVMPNAYGSDIYNESLGKDTMMGPGIKSGIKAVEDGGVSSWIALTCGVWFEFSLAMGPWWFGIDFANKRIEQCDNGNTLINTSTWEQCGRAIASLLSLKELPEDEEDTSPSISQWRNRALTISSFQISQRDILDSVNRVKGLTNADWQIQQEPSHVRYQRGLNLLKTGNRLGFALALYARIFYPNGGANFEATQALDNKILGLPKEDLDEATRRAIGMVDAGFNPLGDYTADHPIESSSN
ncbi:unnamed protein product [Clonostachys rosea]|uniref:NmrA-like domain-containing protein n=1 Tax=Bionectria ochroleuca TaxID=29856 RepID=A0ABY6V3I5_BIOOC|nr:unnamed protein product [Clonostachys rosea]